MEQVLYADILFFINFSMDFITLYLTSRLTSGPPAGVRTAVAAVLGGLYGTMAVVLGIDGVPGVLLSGAVSVGMAAMAFGYGGAKTLFRRAAVFWGIAALLGGVMTALCSFGESITPVGTSSGGTAILFAGSTLCLLFVRLISRFTKRHTVQVRVSLDGKDASFTALCDSGNLLCEPLSARPVILADRSVMGRLIPCGISLSADVPANLKTRLRVIPAKGIGGGDTLCGIVPDSVWVMPDGKEKRCDAVIAVTDLGSTFFGGYPANAPAVLLG